MRLIIKIIFFIIIITKPLYADEAADWLKTEIDFILNAYKNANTSNETRFLMIENTINYNFAGAGIAKFVAGKSWSKADKKTKTAHVEE